MTYTKSISAITFDNLKGAALYFDRIIPLAFRSLRGDRDGIFVDVPEPVPLDVAAKLIFGDTAPKHLVVSYLDNYWQPFMQSLAPLVQPRRSTDPEAYSDLKYLYLTDAKFADGTSIRGQFRRLAENIGIDKYSVVLPVLDPFDSFSESYACLALTQVPLIDTSAASWEQIWELRSDVDAISRLRRLRLFFFENYIGKPRDYIEDDLLRRLDDYEFARRKHGFDAVTAAFRILLDAKTLQAAAVASLTAALFGGPIASVSAGATVELGKLLLEVSTRRAEIKNLSASHDLAYLIEARKVL